MQQGTEEWLNARKLHITASNAQAIASNGKGLQTYIYKVITENYSKNTESYQSEDMVRGNELEPIARELYELEKGCTVKQVGFIEMSKYVGCSPDGLVGEEGGVEIKCLNDANHVYLSLTGKIDSKHDWQMQMCMLVTKRKWWDYVAFNPDLPNELIIIRVPLDTKKQEKLLLGIESGVKLLKQLNEQYGKSIR